MMSNLVGSRMVLLPIAPLILTICLIQTSWLLRNPMHASAQSTDEFVSIDCGSLNTTAYTDILGITWTPDAIHSPGIDLFSNTSRVSSSSTLLSSGQIPYTTLRYFQRPAGINETKFCYSLPAIGGRYYLIRAAFWSGSSGTLPYPTHTAGVVRFRLIVDTYLTQEIVIALPQSDVWIEEMYVRAKSSFVTVCLSAASNTSDAPFINSLELRPLGTDETLGVIAMVKSTNSALRLVDRQNFGSLSANPAVLRYPEDVYDRVWYRSTVTDGLLQATNAPIDLGNTRGRPPSSVVGTIIISKNFNYTVTPSASTSPLTRATTIGQRKYYVSLYFAEFNKDVVTTPGKRVFNVSVSIGTSSLIAQTVDIYARVGVNKVLELTSEGSDPVGPYSGDIDIRLVSTPNSSLSASISGAEILQLVDNPMLTPTASSDVSAIRDISALRRFNSLIGDPCLPLEYTYPWITCNANEQPPKVTSISLSNYGLRGTIPTSINNLDRVSAIYLDQNSLEGTLPDMSSLIQLQTLDLSNNFLSGTIPSSLGNLPKLTYLNLANNNFSGTVPATLLQRKGLKLIYDGNKDLCPNPTANCSQASPTPSDSPGRSKVNIGLIVGSAVGALGLLIVIMLVLDYYCHIRQYCGCCGNNAPENTVIFNP